jgi:DMSO/TMAO reductase YedYZ heme-binding membrane subunit
MKNKYLIKPKVLLFLFLIFVVSVIFINIFKEEIPRKYLSIINFFYFIPFMIVFGLLSIMNLKLVSSKNEKLYTIIPLITILIFVILFIIRLIYLYFKI